MRVFLIPAALLLAAFSFAPPHRQLAASAPVFQPEHFFLGRTEGRGTIKSKFARPGTLVVRSNGHVEKDGTLVLAQTVERPGEPVESRLWRFRKAGAGIYRGTITNAVGPVTGEVSGNCLRLRYKMKRGGLHAEQHIYLQPGGRSAFNRMTVKKFGLTVATVEETIRKLG